MASLHRHVSSPIKTVQNRQARERREKAVCAACMALEWLQTQGVQAGVFGSLVTERFQPHSDVDFLIISCPQALRYTIEAGIEDRMGGIPFDVVYLDEAREPLRSRALGEVMYASNLCRYSQ